MSSLDLYNGHSSEEMDGYIQDVEEEETHEHNGHRHKHHHHHQHHQHHDHHHHPHHEHHKAFRPPPPEDKTAHKILTLLTELGHSHLVEQVPLIDRNFLPCKFCKGAVQIV